MRRILSATAALSLAAALAAPASAQGLHLGAEAGVVLTGQVVETSGGTELGIDPLAGFRGGLSATYGFGEQGRFAVRSGLYYAPKGSDIDIGGGTTLEMRVDYVEVPLLAILNVPVQGDIPLRPRLFGGGQLGFEASCDLRDPSTGASTSCSDDTATLDLGLLFGGGLGVALGGGTVLSVDGGYVYGLTDIDDGVFAGTINNRALQIAASVEMAL